MTGGGGSGKVTESDGIGARSAPKNFGLQPPKNLDKFRDFEENGGKKIVDLFFLGILGKNLVVEKKLLTFFWGGEILEL